MTTLISPANNRPCEFVVARDGFVCLRQDYVTPQVRWFTLAAIERVNPVHTCAEPPKPLTVVLTPHMPIGDLNKGIAGVVPSMSSGVRIVRQPSLWHGAMREVA